MNFLDEFSKNSQESNLMKIRVVAAEVSHAAGRSDRWTDRQTYLTKLVIAFRSFANTSNKIVEDSTVIYLHISAPYGV